SPRAHVSGVSAFRGRCPNPVRSTSSMRSNSSVVIGRNSMVIPRFYRAAATAAKAFFRNSTAGCREERRSALVREPLRGGAGAGARARRGPRRRAPPPVARGRHDDASGPADRAEIGQAGEQRDERNEEQAGPPTARERDRDHAADDPRDLETGLEASKRSAA